MNLVSVLHSAAYFDFVQVDALPQRIVNRVRYLRWIVEQIIDGLPEIPIQSVYEFKLPVLGIDRAIYAIFIEDKIAMQDPNSLLVFASEEGIHPVEEPYFIIVFDVPVVWVYSLRLQKADFLSDKLVMPINEYEHCNVGCLPSSSMRKIPIPWRSTKAAQSADVMRVHPHDCARWQQCRRTVRD